MNIIDAIDELVDNQLEQEASGYDNNINQDKCPHCDDDWHGLPITLKMRQMRDRGGVDIDYSYAEDTSPVLCRGSSFIGPQVGEERAEDNTDWRTLRHYVLRQSSRQESLRRSNEGRIEGPEFEYIMGVIQNVRLVPDEVAHMFEFDIRSDLAGRFIGELINERPQLSRCLSTADVVMTEWMDPPTLTLRWRPDTDGVLIMEGDEELDLRAHRGAREGADIRNARFNNNWYYQSSTVPPFGLGIEYDVFRRTGWHSQRRAWIYRRAE